MATKQVNSRRGVQSVLIGVVIALAMSAGYYVFYYTKTNEKIESVRRKVKAEEKTLATVRKQAPLLKPMTEKVKNLELKLVEYRAKIAGKGEVISLIKVIEREAQRLGLKINNIRTRTEHPQPHADVSASKRKGKGKGKGKGKKAPQVQQPAYTKIVLDSNMQADYYKLAEFLSTLQDLETFVVVESIDVAKSNNVDPELNLKFKMSLYSNKNVKNTLVVKRE